MPKVHMVLVLMVYVSILGTFLVEMIWGGPYPTSASSSPLTFSVIAVLEGPETEKTSALQELRLGQ